MAPGTEGGVTKHQPSGRKMSIYDAAIAYAKKKRRWLCSLGKEYGTGSSRDWAAKGTPSGVRAVIAESFERIHRSNLVGMGVAPLQFTGNASWEKLKLDGTETISIKGLEGKLKPRQKLDMVITRANGRKQTVNCKAGSTRKTKSNISKMAVFCSLFCASLPPKARRVQPSKSAAVTRSCAAADAGRRNAQPSKRWFTHLPARPLHDRHHLGVH